VSLDRYGHGGNGTSVFVVGNWLMQGGLMQRMVGGADVVGRAVPLPNPEWVDGAELLLVSVPVQAECVFAHRGGEIALPGRQRALPHHGPPLLDRAAGAGQHGLR
jgi:hypothetical protein